MSLADIANLAQDVGALVVAVGLIFGMVQVAEPGRQRRESATLQLTQSFDSPEFARACAWCSTFLPAPRPPTGGGSSGPRPAG